jgi:hypothetical protein
MVLPLLFYSCMVLLLVKQTGLKKFLRRPPETPQVWGRLRNFFKPTHFRCMTRAFLIIILKIKMTNELFELVVKILLKILSLFMSKKSMKYI